MKELKQRFLNLLFDKMLSDHGYSDNPIKFIRLNPALMDLLPNCKDNSPDITALFICKVHWGLGIPDLEKLSAVPENALRLIFFGQVAAKSVGGL